MTKSTKSSMKSASGAEPAPPKKKGSATARAIGGSDSKLLVHAAAGDKDGCEAARDNDGLTALSLAISKKHPKLARWLANKMDASDLSILDNEEVSAMDCAVEAVDVDMVRLLARRGADVEAPSKSGATTLMEASRWQSGEMIQALLDVGADPLARDEDGESALIWAIRNENLEAVHALAPVSDHSVHPDAGSPLMAACPVGRGEILRMLANPESGAQVDSDGRCPLLIALLDGSGVWDDILDALLPCTNFWAMDPQGRSPLSVLVAEGVGDEEAVARAAGRIADAMMSSDEAAPNKLFALSHALGAARGDENRSVTEALAPRVEALLQRMLLGESIAPAAKSTKRKHRI